MTDHQWRARTAFRSTTVAVALNLIGMPMDLAIARDVPGVPFWPSLASIAVAAALLGILLALRLRTKLWLCNAVFLVNVAVVSIALWFTNSAYAESGRTWVPFQANKLGMVTVSLLAPELWVGGVSIATYLL